ncbi:sugar phosphate isomerase/epimerase family protein [Novipirellula artificiosorum]|uniref:Xylose isomerase-like TIM barrel n=1 Tax=Novipirellula artificiosorum TaxID=2528016 RepID=A0A5C6DZD7_9BACT|nr:sugar phosphate isomerase/epimerase family protein [Novipirellula artificiosorum]TWU41795.1 Xylose isomerase-like TIM barrel [Novipirellula artificiosorum]
MKRRLFLQSLLAAGSVGCLASPLLGRAPILRQGPSRFQIGLAAYSLRDYFSFMKGKPRKAREDGPAIDMQGFLDYCVREGFDTAELTSYFFEPTPSKDYFLELKRKAYEQGLIISGTAIGNNFTIGKGPKLDAEIEQAKYWIDNAATLGAPHIRFFAGTRQQLDEQPERMAEAIDAIETCAQYAATQGIFLGVENHGKLTAEQCLTIMRQVQSPWVGMNLDTGNFSSDDPYADLEACVPYAVNVQVKASMHSASGKKTPADFDRIGNILRDAGYQGFVILEYEDSQPYENIPRLTDALRKALGQ